MKQEEYLSKSITIYEIIKNLLIPLYKEWKIWLPFSLFSFCLASTFEAGWSHFLYPELKYPFCYTVDCLGSLSHLQRLVSNSIHFREAYPFVDSILYSRSLTLDFIFLKFLTILGIKSGVGAYNLYYFTGYFLIFVFSYIVSRALEFKILQSICISLLYNFIPYHDLRIMHLNLTWYFLIPIFIYLGFVLFSKTIKFNLERKLLYYLPLLFFFIYCIYSQHPYYGAFELIILLLGLIARVIFFHKFDNFKFLFIFLFIIFSIFYIQIFSTDTYNSIYGPNPYSHGVERTFFESELYGLKLIQLLLPRSGHRIDLFSKLNFKYNDFYIHNLPSSLGILGNLGFIFLLFFPFLSNDFVFKKDKRIFYFSFLTLVIFLVATVGGFSSLFALIGSTLLRDWSRFCIVLSFTSIAVIFIILEKQKLSKNLYYIILITITILAMLDQTKGTNAKEKFRKLFHINENDYYINMGNINTLYDYNIKNRFDSDKNFFHNLEKIIPKDSSVYQLPYLPPATIYDHSIIWLHSNSFKTNYGNVPGRTSGNFYISLSQKNILEQLYYLKTLAFKAST